MLLLLGDREIGAMTDPIEEVCVPARDLGVLINALVIDLERYSKTTLVLLLASNTVTNAWVHNGGVLSAIQSAHADLLSNAKAWAKTGRAVSRVKRLNAAVARYEETVAAIRAGRLPPKKKRVRGEGLTMTDKIGDLVLDLLGYSDTAETEEKITNLTGRDAEDVALDFNVERCAGCGVWCGSYEANDEIVEAEGRFFCQSCAPQDEDA